MLLSNHTKILSAVSSFMGLSPYDWATINVTSHSSSPTGPQMPSSDPPIEPRLLARLREYFRVYGTYYWDIVKEHGFHGCRPNLVE